MSKKTHRLRWFSLGLWLMYIFAQYANRVAIRAGVYKRFTKQDTLKVKAQFRKEIDNFFKK